MSVDDAAAALAGWTAGPPLTGAAPRTWPVPLAAWASAGAALAGAGYAFCEFLTAVDEGPDGLDLVACVRRPVDGDLVAVTTRVGGPEPAAPTWTGSHPGAAWYEREVAEMYGVGFTGHPGLRPLLLGPEAPVHPLRRSTPLPERGARPWPGLADPAAGTGPGRRVPLPPGVPETGGAG